MITDTSPQEAQFLALYARYRADLFTFLLIRVKVKEEAEDLLQILWQRLWCAMSDGQNKPKSYLFMIARNLVTDHFRAQKHRAHLPLESETETGSELMHDPPDTEELAEEKVVREETLVLAIASLSSRQQCVVPYTVSGYSIKETSKHLGLPAGTIKNRNYHARKALEASCDERLAVY
jgi:RNA polymerase sigma-70 factor (ECF subfamily)